MGLRASGRVVLPGDRLCVVEEFSPDEGAAATPNGIVVSTVAGIAEYDLKAHKVSVKPFRQSVKIGRGDLVLCQVKGVQDKLILCDIVAIAGRDLKKNWSAAILYKGETPFFTIGDLVVARVRDDVYGVYTLTVRGRGLGAFQAFCDLCGTPLVLRGRELLCTRCKRKYGRRPVVPYYGKVNTLLNIFRGLLSPGSGDVIWKSR
jgi:exosome complex RNA-binding protein Csl4